MELKKDIEKVAEAPVHGVERVGEGIGHEAHKVSEHFEHKPDQEKAKTDETTNQALDAADDPLPV